MPLLELTGLIAATPKLGFAISDELSLALQN